MTSSISDYLVITLGSLIEVLHAAMAESDTTELVVRFRCKVLLACLVIGLRKVFERLFYLSLCHKGFSRSGLKGYEVAPCSLALASQLSVVKCRVGVGSSCSFGHLGQ